MAMSEDDDDCVEIMLIEDMEFFLFSLRDAVSTAIAKGAIEDIELDKYLSVGQLEKSLETFVVGVDEESGLPFLMEEAYGELVDEVSSLFLGCCLSKLAAADLVDTAWCDERNQQVFWVKERS